MACASVVTISAEDPLNEGNSVHCKVIAPAEPAYNSHTMQATKACCQRTVDPSKLLLFKEFTANKIVIYGEMVSEVS